MQLDLYSLDSRRKLGDEEPFSFTMQPEIACKNILLRKHLKDV